MRVSGLKSVTLAVLLAATGAAAMAQKLPKPLSAINPGSWITNDDYPREARRHHIHGISVFRLEIDTTGKVTDCMIMVSSGSKLLDDTTCSLLRQRARFVPAEDGNGKAIPASYTNSFHWIL